MIDYMQLVILFIFIYTVLGLWHMNQIISYNGHNNLPFAFKWWFPLIGWWKVRLVFSILASISSFYLFF